MPLCSCDDTDGVFFFLDAVWTVADVRYCQKLADLFTFLALFSIHLEIFYFLAFSRASIFRHRRLLSQFAASIVLCGLSHLVAACTRLHHSFPLLIALTLLKFLTALFSCATSFALVNLIPHMLNAMVRENLLAKKTEELGREIELVRKKENAIWRATVAVLEIRKSLDLRSVLETCVAQLTLAFSALNCSIWLPNETMSAVVLAAESTRRRRVSFSLPTSDPEISEIFGRKGVMVLGSNSNLGNGSSLAVAIRVPVVRLPEIGGENGKKNKSCFGVLVLQLPEDTGDGIWSSVELGILEGVANEVAVALSHAFIIEESFLVKKKLADLNIALHRTNEQVMNANEAMHSFWAVMTREIIGSSRPITAILSVLQAENWVSEEQKTMVDWAAKLGLLLAGLVEEWIGYSALDGGVELNPRGFRFDSMLKEVARVARFMCAVTGLGLETDTSGTFPGLVSGDEMMISQAILFMVVKVLGLRECDSVVLSVVVENGSRGSSDCNYMAWKEDNYKGSVLVKIGVHGVNRGKNIRSSLQKNSCEDGNSEIDLSFCQRLAKVSFSCDRVGFLIVHAFKLESS
ncbi:Non-specific serine/threonine protein kinase [Bertholletia excelsa]